MKRRGFFSVLVGAPVAAVASSVKQASVGDIISDTRDWHMLKDGGRSQNRRVFVDGAEISGVYYINFTRGFVRSLYALKSGTVTKADTVIASGRLIRQRAKPGCCFLQGTPNTEIPIPKDCEVVAWAEGINILVKTIHGKIETRPL
jgi:hypothetical protein